MSRTRTKSRGFTLVELMFSMAIGSIILLLAAAMLGSSGDGYERVGGTVFTEREARGLFTQLAADFSTEHFHKDGVIEKSSAAWPVDRIGFLSLQPADAQTDPGRIGDLCAIHYYVADLQIGGKAVRCLMRGFRESKDVFDALRNGTVGTLFTPNSTKDEPIAFGVLSFEARPKTRDNAGKWIDWVKNDTIGPDAMDVKLVVARRDLGGKLRTSADWDGSGAATAKLVGNAADAARNANVETYGTILRFGNHGIF